MTLRALPRALAFGRALGTLGYPPIYRCDVLHYAPCNGQRHCFGKCMCLLGALAPVISVVWLRHEAPKRGVLLSKRQEDRSVPSAPLPSGAGGAAEGNVRQLVLADEGYLGVLRLRRIRQDAAKRRGRDCTLIEGWSGEASCKRAARSHQLLGNRSK